MENKINDIIKETDEYLAFFPDKKQYDKHKELYEYYSNHLKELDELQLFAKAESAINERKHF